MLIAQDLILSCLVCWSHRTSCSPHMLIAQDLFLLRLSGLTVDCQFGWDLKFFENFDSSDFIFFLSEGLSKAFIGCKTLFHSAFILQIGKTCIWCSMSWNVWLYMNEMLMHWFLFYVFLFIKFATFLPVHTLQAYWCSLFLFCPRRYFRLDTCPSRRILLFVLGNRTFLFDPLSIKHMTFRLCALDFTPLVLSINSAWIMKNY